MPSGFSTKWPSRATYTPQTPTEEWDDGGDGTVDSRATYTYDADGNLLTAESDRDANGTVDKRCTFDPPCPPEVHRDWDPPHCPDPTCVVL